MNAASSAFSASPASLTVLGPRALAQPRRRHDAPRATEASLQFVEPTPSASAPVVAEWLGQIRRANAIEDRVRLVLWMVSWGALIAAFLAS